MDSDEINELCRQYKSLIRRGTQADRRGGGDAKNYKFSDIKFIIEKIGKPAIEIASLYIEYEDSLVRKRAITKIGYLGEPSLIILTKQLHDEDEQVRIQVIEELSHVGEPALNALTQALNDESIIVRKQAVTQLRKIGEPALNALIKALDDDSVQVREQAVTQVGWIGEAALTVLIKALNDSESKIRKEAIQELGRIGEPSLNALTKALDDDEPKIRKNAIQELARIGEPSLDALTKALKDNDTEIRNLAITKLGSVGVTALPLLTELFKSDDSEIRLLVVNSLPKADEAIDLLTVAINDPIPEIGYDAVNKATNIGLSAIRPVILATEYPHGRVATYAIYALTEYKAYSRSWSDFYSTFFPTETLNSIVSIIMDDIIIRKSARPDSYFNSKVVKNIFLALIPQNPTLRSTIFDELCTIAFEYDSKPRERAIAVSRDIGPDEFAVLVKAKSATNPQAADQIMSMLGGAESTAYFTEAQGQTLAEYRAPLIELEETSRQRWEELTLEARRSSTTSKWMSVGVFIVGTIIVFWAFILLTLSNEPWQQFAAAIAGIGSFLAMYSQRFWKEPVEQIQRFSAQQARLQVAFIGFMNRVAQVRLLFEDAYSKGELPPETMAMYQQWLNEATEKAWQQLSDSQSNTVSNDETA